jgi:hypothetical protein
MMRSTVCTLLLGLMLLSSGCGGGASGPSHFEKRMQTQEEVADAIRAAGGSAELKHYPQGSAWSVQLAGATISDTIIDQLKLLERITELNLSKTATTDEHLERINDVGNFILKLDLSNTAVTDAGLDKLTNLYLIMDLNLTGTRVSAAGVDRFRQARLSNPKVPQMFKSPQIRR